MKQRLPAVIAVLTACLVVATACTNAPSSPSEPAPSAAPAPVPAPERPPEEAVILHGALPAVVTDPDLRKYRESFFQAIGQDLHDKDFRAVTPAELARVHFDTKTKWPDVKLLPAGFNPLEIMERTTGPGLGVTQLHARGITGKGISVAVIDHPMLPAHREFAGRIRYMPPAKAEWTEPSFHGMATASILAGQTSGVAPERHVAPGAAHPGGVDLQRLVDFAGRPA